MKHQPDFERLRKALSFEEPDRVPVVELQVDHPVPETFLGRAIDGLPDEIAFWTQADYDYFILNLSNVVSELYGSMKAPISKTDSCYDEEPVDRKWACEHSGLITSREDLAVLPSPEARSADYEPIKQSLQLLRAAWA